MFFETTVLRIPTSGVFALALAVTALSSGTAEARLVSAKLPTPTEVSHQALHLPTGCAAHVVLEEGHLIRASITDPECLPKGVEARRVPGGRPDFRLMPVPAPR